ncbi:hypothetical protein C8J57DRAFT_1713806 [Mycena rebaudengoi]|nr:hypothetical protein C8J57DRAFT_1713806 [Mycena rebaudengoi]
MPEQVVDDLMNVLAKKAPQATLHRDVMGVNGEWVPLAVFKGGKAVWHVHTQASLSSQPGLILSSRHIVLTINGCEVTALRQPQMEGSSTTSGTVTRADTAGRTGRPHVMLCQASRPHSFLKTTVPEHEYLHPHIRRCRREQEGRCGRRLGIGAVGVRTCVGSAGGVAIADAASGVPGDSAGSAGPVRALEDPELSVRVTSIGGAVAEVAPPSTRAHRHAIPRSSPCSLMARGVYKRRRRGVMEREEVQDDKEPSTPSFRLDCDVNDGRGGRKVSETIQIRGTVEKEDKTQIRLSSGSRAAERTLAQSDPSRNTALNPALNPI